VEDGMLKYLKFIMPENSDAGIIVACRMHFASTLILKRAILYRRGF